MVSKVARRQPLWHGFASGNCAFAVLGKQPFAEKGKMQDRYAGDAGDFAKFALLRHLAGDEPNRLRLGIVWYLFPNEGHNSDGRHISYLTDQRIAARDPVVHSILAKLINDGRRSIFHLQRAGLLPEDTIFHDSVVTSAGSPRDRILRRADWFNAAMNRTAEADLIFLDPDNGIETPALDKRAPKAGKYVFWDELIDTWKRGKCVVLYNHLNRSAPARIQTFALHEQIKSRLPGNPTITPLLFRRGSCRHMWVIAQPHMSTTLSSRIESFLEAGWRSDTHIYQAIGTSSRPDS